MSASVRDAASIQQWCVGYISKLLGTPAERIDPSVDVERLGLDSATAVALIMSLEEWLDIELMPELLFDYPSIATLSNHLAGRVAANAPGVTERSA
jgi:acyl carrier protein